MDKQFRQHKKREITLPNKKNPEKLKKKAGLPYGAYVYEHCTG